MKNQGDQYIECKDKINQISKENISLEKAKELCKRFEVCQYYLRLDIDYINIGGSLLKAVNSDK